MKYQPRYPSFSQKLIPLMIIAFMLANLLTACSSPKVSTFEGLFVEAFELSVFYPCGMSTPARFDEGVSDNDSGYWLTSISGSGFNEQLENFFSLREPTGELHMYVKFLGTLSPTKQNGYGHLGMYSKQISVIDLLDMQPWVDHQCDLEG